MESKTPRTDAFCISTKTLDHCDTLSGWLDFAEKLETELAEARAEIERKDLKLRQIDIECDTLIKQQRKDKTNFADTLQRLSQEIERKDKLIEQMREALNAAHVDLIISRGGKATIGQVEAALSAVEKREQ